MPPYRFHGFCFDPASGVVLRPDGTEIGLRPKSAEVLRALVESGGRTVDRGALMKAAWPGVFVTDDNITQCIIEIRRALGEDASRLLRTLPKRGYLLKVDSTTPERNLAMAAPRPTAPPDRPSIAVLSFINLTGDADQEYLSDGVADEIISQLARGGTMLVIARSSSFSYRGRGLAVKRIASELSVRYVLEGSVRRAGADVRVSAQLVDSETEAHIWAKRYDRALTAVFAVQEEIAQAVALELTPAIAKAELQRAIRKPPASLSAWEAYQRGLWHLSRPANNDDLNQAGKYLLQADALDPLFADAHAVLARHRVAEATQGRDAPHSNGLTQAYSAAQTALRLDPDNAAAHAALAWILSNTESSERALEHAEHATGLNPSDPNGWLAKGHILVFEHRATEARSALQTALRLDPRGRVALGVAHHYAVSLYLEGDHEACVTAARKVVRDYPDFGRTYLYLVASLSHLGRNDEARQALQEAISVAPEFFPPRLQSRPAYVHPADHERMLQGLRRAGWRG